MTSEKEEVDSLGLESAEFGAALHGSQLASNFSFFNQALVIKPGGGLVSMQSCA